MFSPSKPHIQWPNGLTIDHLANRVYWVDAQRDLIASCDLDGTPASLKTVLKRVNQLVHPFGVAIHKDFMYWDDWNNKAIFMANKNNGKGITKVRGDMNGAMDLKIFSTLHRDGASNACSKNPCSHLCVGMPKEGHACMCPDGEVSV